MKKLFSTAAALSLGLLSTLILSGQSTTPTTPTESGEARAERFLTAMGGRAAWADVKSYVIRATHHEANQPASYANTIFNDFASPRVRIEAKSATVEVQRAIEGDRGWVRRNGIRSELTPEQVRDETRWWEANTYRTIHRLAANDPELTVRAVGPNRLEIWRTDGVRLNWFELNAAAEPIRFGTWTSEEGTVFGPLAQHGKIKCAKWGSNATGTWRYEVVELITTTGPSNADFSQP